jgi:hypothetical protein
MRIAAFALVSACALLAACNPSAPSSQTADSSASAPANGGLPTGGGASYRAEMQIMGPEGQNMPVVMIHAGNKSRTEMTTPAGPSVMIMDMEAHEGFMIMNLGGSSIARRMDLSQQASQIPSEQWKPETIAAATRTGTCNVAGESGVEYTRTTDAGPIAGCVTSDGIILRTSTNGRTMMEATRIQRGPQDPNAFVVPPGVQVIEGNDMSAIAAAVARAKGGH